MAWRSSLAIAALLTGALVACEPVDQPLAPDLESSLERSASLQPASTFIVVLDDRQVPASRVPSVADEMAQTHAASVTFTYQRALRGFAAVLAPGRAAELAADPRVRLVEPDRIARVVPGPLAPPPGRGKSGGGDGSDACSASAQQTPWGIGRVRGGGAFTGGGTAWVIDTGIDLGHCDLNVDAGRSANFVTRGKNSPNDGHGHGSHVAGTIAAIDNGWGVVGVAPGATLVAVRVLDNSGSGTYSGVIAGVDYVAANGQNGDVANMSLGGPPSQALDDAVRNAAAAGISFVLAAGNESTEAGTRSPARTNGPNVYTVSAVNSSDHWASFSNYGNPPVDYAAPGVSVYSTYRGGGYATMSGTSMAAPHVSGILLRGGVATDGAAIGDPDGNPDPIAVAR